MAQNMSVSVTLQLVDRLTQNARNAIQSLQSLTRTVADFNRVAGAGSNTPFGRMQAQVRAVANDVRALTSQFNALGRSMATPTGGSFAQRQIADMRQLLSLQRQIIANNARMVAGPPGAPSRGAPVTGNRFLGRSGFSPNASLIDRAQYRAVNMGEQSLISGALELDRARTALAMLAIPRRDPNNPGQVLPGVITQDVVNQAEQAAAELSQGFRVLNRAHILDTFREIVTQFQNVEDAFAFLPQLLNIQEWQVLQGDTVEQARSGMLSLLRAIGLSGRLIGNDGRLKMDEAGGFLETYLRARMIGGADVTPDQVFQVMKYLKATGQSLSPESLLTAFIAMPDIRASTFGNQLNMLVRQLTGGATQAAQQAMAAGGLGTIAERTASGPHMFTPVDEELLRDSPFAWFNRHIMGPTGYLRRRGIDPVNATQAQIAAALRPIFSNQSAENIANMIVSQQQEWRNQIENALRFNLTPEARQQHAAGSGWHQLATARSALQDVLGSIAENFKILLNPAIESVSNGLKTLARWIDPRIGSPTASLSLIGGGLAGGLWMLRSLVQRMGPWSRTLLGGGAGFLLGGGGIAEGLMGALLGRQLGGTAATTAAAGAAGAAAGSVWGGRFVAAARWLVRGLRSITIWSVAGYVVGQIVENWESVKTRLLAIWEELRQAAPVWLGGEGKGWRSFAQGPAMTQTGQELGAYLQQNERSMQDWLRGTSIGQWLIRNGLAMSDSQLAHQRMVQDYRAMGIDMGALEADARARAMVPGGQGTTVTTGNIITNVYVTQSNASPQAIGEAAGNAVQSGLRGALGDPTPVSP